MPRDKEEGARRAREAFRGADTDGSGTLNKEEMIVLFKSMYKTEGMARSKAKVEAEVNAAMKLYDLDGSGALDEDEFLNMLLHAPTFKFNQCHELQEMRLNYSPPDEGRQRATSAYSLDNPRQHPSRSPSTGREEAEARLRELEAALEAKTSEASGLSEQLEAIQFQTGVEARAMPPPYCVDSE
jgi:hypothetical protein